MSEAATANQTTTRMTSTSAQDTAQEAAGNSLEARRTASKEGVAPEDDAIGRKVEDNAGDDEMGLVTDRRLSREWDASKVPPSQFQKRKGSIYSTPGSRDGHVKGSDRDKAYFDKLKEKGWHILGKDK